MRTQNAMMTTRSNQPAFKGSLTALLTFSLLAVASSAPPCDSCFKENFDSMRAPLLPAGWVASQGINVTGAPFWVTSSVTPQTTPNDAFSIAPDNILDNRLDTPVILTHLGRGAVFFYHNYNLQSGRDGAVLEISSPSINGGAFTDITDPAVGGTFFTGGYNGTISTAFQSPIAGRMAWSGNSDGYVGTFVGLGNAAGTFTSETRLRFRLVSDNGGASAGWRIDSFALLDTTDPATPTATATASPTATATATPIASPCGSPNVIADSTFEAGTPWPDWTVQTSTNFGTPLCNTAACGTGSGTAPSYAGDNWAWFGGANAAETATLGQSVSIITDDQATLSFVMRIGRVSSPFTDVLNVRVDGIIVQSYPEPTQAEAAYSPRTINLSAFADGASHFILFEYIGPTTSPSNYAVDNVTLTAGPECPSPTPSPTATASATATVPTSTPTPTPFFERVFWEGFDAVTAPALPAGWLASFTPGPANCTHTGTCALGTNWATNTATSQTAPNAAFHDAPGCVTDANLDTPSIFIPTSFYPSVVYFWQNYDLEASHDGGVLEISIDGGAFTDIVAAGGSFSGGDYNGPISTAFLSPIAGRPAWTGNSGGFINTVVSLPSTTMGHNVVLRFRLATDCSVAGTGWYVDSISIAYFNDLHPAFAISGAISYCSNPAPGPVPNATLTLTGGAAGTTPTSAAGTYSFTGLPPGNYTVTPTKTKRVPGSGGINTVDVIAVQKQFLNISPALAGCHLAAADVNASNTVNTVDVIAIQKFFLIVAGIANVGKYQFTPANRTYSPLITNQNGQNYDALVFGDVVAPFVE